MMTVYHRPRAAAQKLGIALSTLWALAKSDPDFPESVKLGPKTTVFSDAELDAYVQKKAQLQRVEQQA